MMTSRCVHRRFPRHCVAAGPQQSRIFAARATIMHLRESARSITVVASRAGRKTQKIISDHDRANVALLETKFRVYRQIALRRCSARFHRDRSCRNFNRESGEQSV